MQSPPCPSSYFKILHCSRHLFVGKVRNDTTALIISLFLATQANLTYKPDMTSTRLRSHAKTVRAACSSWAFFATKRSSGITFKLVPTLSLVSPPCLWSPHPVFGVPTLSLVPPPCLWCPHPVFGLVQRQCEQHARFRNSFLQHDPSGFTCRLAPEF
ncbi:hypothetical protein DUNSADRAFT_2615, partial [Dunaliella salina]